MYFCHVVKMAESVASASDSEHESTSYASSSLGHLRPPPRKKGNPWATFSSQIFRETLLQTKLFRDCLRMFKSAKIVITTY